ncbi:hypothetical protein RUM43_001908 [Polyplax serrata]|uniref:Uncharacterized protein n=1 Tax=Polyplax serrata TaxID=468196 RepID=A0AAN8SEI9_POLSC
MVPIIRRAKIDINYSMIRGPCVDEYPPSKPRQNDVTFSNFNYVNTGEGYVTSGFILGRQCGTRDSGLRAPGPRKIKKGKQAAERGKTQVKGKKKRQGGSNRHEWIKRTNEDDKKVG